MLHTDIFFSVDGLPVQIRNSVTDIYGWKFYTPLGYAAVRFSEHVSFLALPNVLMAKI